MLSKVCLRFHTLRCVAGKQGSNVCYKSTSAQQKKRDPRSSSLSQKFREKAHTNSVVVRNINWSISKEDLQDHFSQYASIDYINYPLANSGFHLGFAEVKFEDDTTFKEVLKRNSVIIDGYDVKIVPSHRHFQNLRKMNAKKSKQKEEETSSPAAAAEDKVEETESEPLNAVEESEEQQEDQEAQKKKKRKRKRKKAEKDTTAEEEDASLSSNTEVADVKEEKLSDSDVIVERVQVGAKL